MRSSSDPKFTHRVKSIMLRNYLRYEMIRGHHLVVSGYPKSGTTWVTQLLALINNLEYRQGHIRLKCKGLALHTHSTKFNGTANLVYVVRDPRETICSAARAHKKHNMGDVMTKNGVLTDWFVERALTELEGSRCSMKAHLQTAIDKNWNFVRYEDLKTEPVKSLINLANSLDLNNDTKKTESAINTFDFEVQRNKSKSNKKWFFSESGMNSWKNLLTPNQKEYIQKNVGEQAAQFGYDLSTR